MSSKKTMIAAVLALILSAAALCISIISLNSSNNKSSSSSVESSTDKNDSKDIQYVLFVGTNDKDTYQPFGTEQECKDKVDEVLTKHVEGFTIQEAKGGWTNENGTVDHEYTIVILLSDTTIDKVHAICDDLIKTFNQSTVLIQANETKTEFYSGK